MTVILNARSSILEPQALPPVDGRPLSVWRVDNGVGEAPVWDAARQCLWWIDIRAPELLRLVPGTHQLTRWTLPEVVGALALRDDGQLLLALRREVGRFDPATAALHPFAEVESAGEHPHNRLNDGKVSPSGRWWVVGSMDERAEGKQALGSLYRLDAGGDCRRLALAGLDGLRVANGIAWSLDGQTLYFSDSWRGQVWHAPWVEASGTLGEPRPFARSDEAAGRPDGALVDAQGRYLSAGVSAGCLNRFAASGEHLQRIPLPCRAPTMPCFGGPDGQDLFITSLVRHGGPSPAEGPEDGQLYRLQGFGAGVPGVAMRSGA